MASATSGDDISIHGRPTLRSAILARARAWLAAISRRFTVPTQQPRLSNHLPAIAPRDNDANACSERMLLDIMRAPPDYLDAAILMVRATHALRKQGGEVFAEGFVTFALSRMVPDSDGTITIKRVRECAGDIPFAKGVVPVLLRLAEQGVVSFDVPAHDTDKSRVIDMDRVRIRLLVVP